MPNAGFLASLFGWKRDAFDERFIMHRFKSTRLAVLVGTIMILVLFTYHAVAQKTIRWDLFGILAAMAAVKISAMAYYQRTH
jgi:uncharacterized membrane protein